MQRKVFDVLASAGGLLMVVVLVVAGGLLMWGYSFANSNVHNQLAEQQIVFPSKAAFAHPVAGSEITPSMIGTVSKYAGEPLTTGAQAEVYANDFIDLRPAECVRHGAAQGIGCLHRSRSQSADGLPGHHAPWFAA
jgi:hypothetical protein